MFRKGVIFLFMILAAQTRARQVCYGKYGCFKKSKDFRRIAVGLPQDPSVIGTKFTLFTRSSPQSTIIDDHNTHTLRASNFKISKQTIFVIHGFSESINTWAQPMKTALLNRKDCNVILVDWSNGAKGPNYGQASGNARLVGAQTAELIKFLISSASGSPDLGKRFYIVGFSLGAHVAGYAGSYLGAQRIKLDRITGLDPAGLWHTNVDAAFRLDPNDAHHVDVIHTDTGSFGTSRSGTVGHIDFFPNGGDNQPGCRFNIFDPVTSAACDHMRAPEYYTASVRNLCSWKAYPCQNYGDFTRGKCKTCPPGGCPSMGFDADPAKHTGRFYLQTNSKAPFCGKTSF